MKIVVLNGSPKGIISVTMQYIHFIEKIYQQHEFKIINVSQDIQKIQKNQDVFKNILEHIQSSDGVIWAFPLYVFTVHSSYHRFIELIFDRKNEYVFKEKYAAILATSIHFFDHTAINYINAICDDLNMKYVNHLSLHMYDLKKELIQTTIVHFAQKFIDTIQKEIPTTKNYSSVQNFCVKYTSKANQYKINLSGKKLVVLVDSLDDNNLRNMVNRFKNSFSETIDIFELKEMDIKGSCMGCLKCGYNYECVYTGKDEYINFYKTILKNADVIVFAGKICYRYLSSTWKIFFERGFFNTHTPSLVGKQFGFILSGSFRQNSNLRQIIEAYTEWQGSNLAGIVTDEYNSSSEIDQHLQMLASNLVHLSNIKYIKPATFLGIAGMKIFRDEIWGKLRFPFVADHKAFKANHIYDFPQKNYKSRIRNSIIVAICKIPNVRKLIYSNKLKTSMLNPLKKIINQKNINY